MTKLNYLSDTYMLSGKATIEAITPLEDGWYDIVLDATLFYPQGGGQPSDTGTITTTTGVYDIEKVTLDETGSVHHRAKYREGILSAHQEALLQINRERRILNARIHSAGHLIDIALHNIGYSLTPTKGYHFPDGPYVEYSGSLDTNIEEIKNKLTHELQRLIEAHIPIDISYGEDIESPLGKIPRYVAYEGYEGCGCGGTHVRYSGEIGAIALRGIKMKDGKWRVGYEVLINIDEKNKI